MASDNTDEKSPDSEREGHLFKLADAFYQNLLKDEDYEYGGWGQDGKRPFGNSAVLDDVLKIIGVSREIQDKGGPNFSEEQKEYAAGLYKDLGGFLKRQWKLHRGFTDEDRLKELQDLHEAELCECSTSGECDTAFLFRLIQEARKTSEEEEDAGDE